MRIVQLSDIHLSKNNLEDLQNFFLDALLKDLENFHCQKPIDIFLLTGDLVDKGGSSFGIDNYYELFEQEFITPISERLNVDKKRFLFIPGNHDISRDKVDVENEFYLATHLTKETANERLKKMAQEFIKDNYRIENFKKFEQKYHSSNTNYSFSNNESLFFTEYGTDKVGFALINDSWRCSEALKKEQHFIGNHQLFNAKKFFQANGTKVNIIAFHHPLELLNESESEEIENILKTWDFHVVMFGHKHSHKIDSLINSTGGIIRLNGRAAFNNSHELHSKYQPGYSILDVNIKEKAFTFYARKFIKHDGFRFDSDVDSMPGGTTSVKFEGQTYIPLSRANSNTNEELPSGYSADVNRVVKLLIGKSLYPNPYIFVRELIQNAVDACNRIKEKQSYTSPKIVVRINTQENYFEVSDEGDGMSKKILKEHFAIVGKSISQEFNEATGNFNLISQFGIGFISTFIAAQKVSIITKNESDECISFEIEDVFKGFKYNQVNTENCGLSNKTGTIVRVYLKQEYHPAPLFHFVRQYCRHIKNFEVYLNSVLQVSPESWGIENGNFEFHIENSRYQAKLTISASSRPLVASNSGFLIANDPPPIVPHRFPYIIGGEINFNPKAIDFDLSRSNIIETNKSYEVKREISTALRSLFREGIKSNIPELKASILSYIQYYISAFDNEQRAFRESYIDFFSKDELVDMCLDLWQLTYQGEMRSLRHILNKMIAEEVKIIYHYQATRYLEYDRITARYLSDNGHLVFEQANIPVLFRGNQRSIPNLLVMQIVAREFNLRVASLYDVVSEQIVRMKMDKAILPDKVRNVLLKIESETFASIDVAKFGKDSTPSIKMVNNFLLNYEHPNFQNIIRHNEEYSEETIKTYLRGLLRLSLI